MLERWNRDKEHMLKENQKEGGHGQNLSSERKCEIARLARGRQVSTWQHRRMRSTDGAGRWSVAASAHAQYRPSRHCTGGLLPFESYS